MSQSPVLLEEGYDAPPPEQPTGIPGCGLCFLVVVACVIISAIAYSFNIMR